MDETEEVLFDLFRRLREYLVTEYGVGLALKSEGENFTLRLRARRIPAMRNNRTRACPRPGQQGIQNLVQAGRGGVGKTRSHDR